MLGMFHPELDEKMLKDIQASHKMKEDMRHDVSSALR